MFLLDILPAPLTFSDMHELALMEGLVTAVEERIEGARIDVVRIEIGRLVAAIPDTLRFCFVVCARGTRLEGASLEIEEIDGRAECRTCGSETPLETPLGACPCGSFDLRVISGEELRVREVEVVR